MMLGRTRAARPNLGPAGWLAFLFMVSAAPGCHTNRATDPARTATEQLLISTAADRAASGIFIGFDAPVDVFVREGSLESYDKPYVLGLLRARIADGGGRIVGEESAARFVVEPRVGALSINRDSLLIGIPSLTIPIPLAGAPLETIEIALFKRETQEGVARLSFAVYERSTGALIRDVGPGFGTAEHSRYSLLFVPWTIQDIVPEAEDEDPR